jgi:hypothetical protein
MPSVQPAVTQTFAAQSPVAQSASTTHFFVGPHAGQVPPQSTSVSFPLSTVSSHAGAAQIEAVQTPDSQSPPKPQAASTGQAGQLPPQSTSVSLPLATLSLHVGA